MSFFRARHDIRNFSLFGAIVAFALFVAGGIVHAAIPEPEPDVIIVGAGLAGLSTAYRLKKSGISFLVLELTPHIGGRIRTASYPEKLAAEVGLEEFWADNPSLEIFQELNIPLEKSATAFSSFLYQGRLQAFTQDSNQEFLGSLLSAQEMKAYQQWDRKMAQWHQQLQSPSIDPALMKLKDISFADWVRKSGGLSRKAQEFIRIESEPEYGTSWENISALDGIAEWHIFSGQGSASFHVVGGNQRAALAIAENLGMDRVLLNQQVTNIQSLPRGVVVTATDTADFKQHVYHAKYAVTTAPLFRLNEIQFEPPISEERNQAIQTQTWGAYFTAHVIVDAQASRFWTIAGESVLPILSDGPLGVIYGGNDEAEPTRTPAETVMLNLLITGDAAERFNARTGGMDDIRASLLKEFEKNWPGFGQYVKKVVFYRYHPRAIASWPVGRSRFDELSQAMRKPQGRVYFAGDFTEGTHSDGAAHSAIRVVQDIVKRENLAGDQSEYRGVGTGSPTDTP